ncbi:hypothetical protein DL766_005642 [Monosporascus sp. MC13-8B]|uniref:NACHT domain-containing protein n=1 Tax=Monosporascus cannonballus TaxID=155416 RepID=A0ABY0H4H9_9PEZI|nr:hypothetical protein DL762_005536 [Monosporascus cannonballus]RYO89517.1 hypothetical protein DL763_005617 [Monosporascus cannonballus]RYP28864.1 hypothetical protein DL766_005642 [Monosporascus sp. MC13-8B]
MRLPPLRVASIDGLGHPSPGSLVSLADPFWSIITMSSALAKAAPLKAEIRLAQAVSQFEADLSTEQKTTFLSLSGSDINAYQSELDRWANLIKEEVSLLMGQNIEEQSAYFKAWLKSSKSESNRQRLKAYVRVLDSCSTYDYQTTWKEIRKVGNATLFDRTPEYEDWKAQTDSSTLICTGKLGSGKSVLLANIVDDLNLHVQNLTVVEEFIDETASVLAFERVFKILQRALPPDFKALEAGIVPGLSLEQFAKHSTIAIPEDNPDIEGFISAELERRLESGKLIIGDPTLILEIQDTLLEGAQGMFLWVALQIESLCAAKTDEALRQALTDLPKDLPETFSRILRRSGELGTNYQTRTFELVTAAHRPLTTEELREALSVVPGDANWNPARLLNDVYSALSCCGSLITVDEEGSTVRLIHQSVKQFLLRGFRDPTGAIFTSESANRTMGGVIVTYLNYGVFDTQISTMAVPQIMTKAAPSRIIRSIDASSRVQSLALKLLKSRGQPNCDVRKVLAEASNQFKSPSVDQFHFYSYAKSHWLQHAWCISEQMPVLYTLLLSLPKRNVVDINTKDDDSRTPLFRAAEKGHVAIAKLLLENGADPETRNDSGQTPLLLAAAGGHEAVVKLLLEKGVKLETKDEKYGQTPLLLAVENGHEGVVKLLLEKGANLETKNEEYGETPLLLAVKNGDEGVVELLLDKGANLETKNEEYGQTPLLLAVENGHEGVVKLLLEKGTNLEIEDYSGRTPLLLATEKGHEAVVKLLLEKGANPKTKDILGRTPLSVTEDRSGQSLLSVVAKTGNETTMTSATEVISQEPTVDEPKISVEVEFS